MNKSYKLPRPSGAFSKFEKGIGVLPWFLCKPILGRDKRFAQNRKKDQA